MMRPSTGAFLPIFCVLAGCASPLSLPEAKSFADSSVTRYCRARTDCGTPRQTKSQRMSGRWLIDYDVSGRMLTVAVDDNGAVRLDIWTKR